MRNKILGVVVMLLIAPTFFATLAIFCIDLTMLQGFMIGLAVDLLFTIVVGGTILACKLFDL